MAEHGANTTVDYLVDAKTFLGKSKEYFLVNDHEAIGEVATEMMIGDHTFNGRGTRSGWRYQNAVWAKKRYLRKLRDYQYRHLPILRDFPREEKDYELFEDLHYRLDRLPHDISISLKRYYFEKKSILDIAKELNTSKATIYSNIQKGLDRLRKIYASKEIV